MIVPVVLSLTWHGLVCLALRRPRRGPVRESGKGEFWGSKPKRRMRTRGPGKRVRRYDALISGPFISDALSSIVDAEPPCNTMDCRPFCRSSSPQCWRLTPPPTSRHKSCTRCTDPDSLELAHDLDKRPTSYFSLKPLTASASALRVSRVSGPQLPNATPMEWSSADSLDRTMIQLKSAMALRNERVSYFRGFQNRYEKDTMLLQVYN